MNEQNKIVLNVVAHHQDNGDGSTSVAFYNTREELDARLEDDGYGFTVSDIESGDDPYETGTLTAAKIKLTLGDNGHLKLDGPFYVTSDD